MAPGLLYVTMQPKETLPPTQFHDWYNNEHGPNRLRLPFIPNGFRYHASDLEQNAGSQAKPEWMAWYDITDMEEMTKESYQRLRRLGIQSQREADTMKNIWVDRKLLDFVGEKVNQGKFVKLEDMEHFDKNEEGNTVVSVSFIVDSDAKSKVDEWLEKTEIPKIEKIDGWRRSRRFVTSTIDPRKDGKIEFLTIHEFAPQTNLQSLDVDIKSAPSSLQDQKIRTYSLYYTFGPAPRHLTSVTSWTSTDKTVTTFPSTSPEFGTAIESYITAPDSVSIPYRLEGSSDPSAPLIVLSNSVLVTWGIWDSFLASFFSHPSNRKYRVLRYLTRGRFQSSGSQPVTVDLLASDILSLLDALRVPKAKAVIGVSLGGATALCAGVKHPSRFSSFISCDTSAKSPAGNSKTWGDRIAIAEQENTTASIPPAPFAPPAEEVVVGDQLAEATVRRWFVPESYDDPEISSRIAVVKHMCHHNSLAGFKKCVHALFDYDLKEASARYSAGKGAFLVGAGDGVLPKPMREMSQELGSREGGVGGGEYKVIEKAGHLPMVEKPDEVAEFVTGFLEKV